MCNRIVQYGRPVKPGEATMVMLRGPQGEFELPFTEAIFGGPAISHFIVFRDADGAFGL